MSRSFRRKTHRISGRRMGAYRLEGHLGQGGMGEVFLAFDERLERRVAIKRLRPDVARTDSQWKRFLSEARAVAKLSHPTIVQVYEFLEDGPADCIVMEYVEGCNVAQLLSTAGTFDLALAVSIARQVAAGLAEAHAHDIIHRDLKAENVIVAANGDAKIVDFGLAKRLADDEPSLTERGVLLGTYRAMSPEQVQGTRVDARTDLFSLGVLLYEMLAGNSPFRGDHPLEILRKIAEQSPAPIGATAAELPPELVALLDRLLEKDPDRRPPDARTVSRTLEGIVVASRLQRQPALSFEIPPSKLAAISPTETSLESVGDRYGDLPTAPIDRQTAATTSSGSYSGPVGRRWWYLLALLAVFVVVILTIDPRQRGRAEIRRVLVLEPVTSEDDSGILERLSSAVMMATLDGLAALEGLVPLDPSLLPPGMMRPSAGTPPSPLAAARAVVADEVLRIRVEAQGEIGQVSLRRIDSRDGEVRWSKSFQVPSSLSELPLLTDAVSARLSEAYPEYRPKPGHLRQQIHAEDHNLLLHAKLRINSGEGSLVGELEQMEALAERSPRFLEAHLLAAEVARVLFLDTREAGYLERSQRYLEDARLLDPYDPRPLIAEFRRALLLGEADKAKTALAELERLDPADPEIPVLTAELAQHQGRVDVAMASMQAAVERYPSWRNLFLLADLEYQGGRIAEARRHFEEILELAPKNLWVMGRLGAMEMLFGDLTRAEAMYRELIEIVPYRPYFTNLGLIYFLRGRYPEAIAAYQQALELDPEHVVVRLNLADAELARGRTVEARTLYREVLQTLDATGISATRPVDLMNKAQCLVYLGRAREAVEITQKTLQLHPDHPEIVFLASLVYAVAGERASALVNIASAVEKGYQPRWFRIPAFDSLREDPEFEALFALDSAGRGR